jgi:hypothetical protein
MINLAPTTGLISALEHQRLDWSLVFSELIDNAFDAGAVRCEIVLSKDTLIVRDDGSGCVDPSVMMRLGDRKSHKTTVLGRFGIGAKDVALWLGGKTQIQTTHGATTRIWLVDWDDIQRRDSWDVADPTEEPAGDRRGTSIRFHFKRRRPSNLEERIEDLGYLYAPALEGGRQLIFTHEKKPRLVPRFVPPTNLTDVVDTTIVVHGRSARVHAGIVPVGTKNPRPGLAYSHGFRVIIPRSAFGCGDYSTQRIVGSVRLGEGWRLTKNKDDISEFKEELGDAVFAVLSGILEKARTQSQRLESDKFIEGINLKLASVMDAAKERRDAAGGRGTHGRGGGGGVRTRVKKTQPGEKRLHSASGSLRVDFDENEKKVGRVELDGRRIWLGTTHPFIDEALKASDQRALVVLALTLFVDAVQNSEKQRAFAWAQENHDLPGMLSELLSSEIRVVGEPALRAV